MKKQLFSSTVADGKEKCVMADQLELSTKESIPVALDMIKEGATVYLHTEESKSDITSFSDNLDILFEFILGTNISNLLIVLDEFQILDYLSQLPILLRLGRKKIFLY